MKISKKYSLLLIASLASSALVFAACDKDVVDACADGTQTCLFGQTDGGTTNTDTGAGGDGNTIPDGGPSTCVGDKTPCSLKGHAGVNVCVGSTTVCVCTDPAGCDTPVDGGSSTCVGEFTPCSIGGHTAVNICVGNTTVCVCTDPKGCGSVLPPDGGTGGDGGGTPGGCTPGMYYGPCPVNGHPGVQKCNPDATTFTCVCADISGCPAPSDGGTGDTDAGDGGDGGTVVCSSSNPNTMITGKNGLATMNRSTITVNSTNPQLGALSNGVEKALAGDQGLTITVFDAGGRVDIWAVQPQGPGHDEDPTPLLDNLYCRQNGVDPATPFACDALLVDGRKSPAYMAAIFIDRDCWESTPACPSTLMNGGEKRVPDSLFAHYVSTNGTPYSSLPTWTQYAVSRVPLLVCSP